MKHSIILLLFYLAAMSLFAQVTENNKYICPPCGCEKDQQVFNRPGVCPACQMTLLNKDDPSKGLLYKNIYPSEVCESVKVNRELLLLDVRSVEEFNGTSSKLGKLKNALNIPIGDIETRVNEIEDYKSKEIIVYCSISVRSPRVSQYLAENGFTNVKNMMGGMTLWNRLSTDSLTCKNRLLLK